MIYHVWLKEVCGISSRAAAELISAFGSAEAVYKAGVEKAAGTVKLTDAERKGLTDRSLSGAEKTAEACRSANIDIITLSDKRYPARLKMIADPPTVLYVRGKLPDMEEAPAFGIVGSRHPRPESVRFASRIAADAALSGFTVVSGLAAGIDSTAQEAVVRAGGATVAVLGTAIDNIYPHENKTLAYEIMKKGAVISEYPPGKKTFPAFFKARNRIISGLSVGVLVIQATLKSGSLSTADHALEQNRDVFVSPGLPTAEEWSGSNELLKRGAILTTGVSDIIEEYKGIYALKIKEAPESPADIPAQAPAEPRSDDLSAASDEEKKILSVVDGKMHIDEIIRKSGLPAEKVSAMLMMLELSGAVEQKPGQFYIRIQ